jgi:hypothetical protein
MILMSVLRWRNILSDEIPNILGKSRAITRYRNPPHSLCHLSPSRRWGHIGIWLRKRLELVISEIKGTPARAKLQKCPTYRSNTLYFPAGICLGRSYSLSRTVAFQSNSWTSCTLKHHGFNNQKHLRLEQMRNVPYPDLENNSESLVGINPSKFTPRNVDFQSEFVLLVEFEKIASWGTRSNLI